MKRDKFDGLLRCVHWTRLVYIMSRNAGPGGSAIVRAVRDRCYEICDERGWDREEFEEAEKSFEQRWRTAPRLFTSKGVPAIWRKKVRTPEISRLITVYEVSKS